MGHQIPYGTSDSSSWNWNNEFYFFSLNTEICQLEPRTDNTKGTCEEEEEKEDESYSLLSEDYDSSDSENESSSPQRKKGLSPG